jgi:predicted nucleic acid-binding protein
MKIGVDSCVLIAGVHANHPLHCVAAEWLIGHIASDDLIVCHHSLLEAYAVLTRLPGRLRTSGAEAWQLIETTVRPHMQLAKFDSSAIWSCLERLTTKAVMGGGAYDAFILDILAAAGVQALATFNTAHFTRLSPPFGIIDPSIPETT